MRCFAYKRSCAVDLSAARQGVEPSSPSPVLANWSVILPNRNTISMKPQISCQAMALRPGQKSGYHSGIWLLRTEADGRSEGQPPTLGECQELNQDSELGRTP